MGLSGERALPIEWDGKTSANVLWKVPLPHTVSGAKPDHNQSSPIVWGDRVYVCTVSWPKGTPTSEYPEQRVTCYRTTDGSQVWDTLVPPGPWKLSDLRGGYGAPTPTTDGERIFVAFGSATLAALGADGKILWQQMLENPTDIDVAFSSSPVLYGKHALLLVERNGKKSTLTAYDQASGEIAWQQKRPDVAFAHSTPAFATVGGKTQMLVAASNALQGLDPATGEVLWSLKTPGDVTSPTLHEGVVYTDSGRGGPGVAVDPVGAGPAGSGTVGAGPLDESHIKWKTGNMSEGLSSPVVAGGFLFRSHNPGIIRVHRWSDGEQVMAERMQGISVPSSPFATADGLVYFASGGKSFILKPGDKPVLLATNDLGDPGYASPAVSGGRIYIKGGQYLFCIGAR